MLRRSISSGHTSATATATAWRADRLGEALPLGRGEALRVVEARQRRRGPGSTTAAATTGPASGPMPTSSTPATTSAPARRSRRRSAKSAATRRALAALGREARLDASRQRAGARAGVRSQDAQQARQGARVARRAQLLAERREGRAGRAAHGSSPSSGGAPRRRSRRRTRRRSSGSFATAATLRCQARSGTDGEPQTRLFGGTSSSTPARTPTKLPSPIAQLVGGAALGHEDGALAHHRAARDADWATMTESSPISQLWRDHAPGCRSSRRGRSACRRSARGRWWRWRRSPRRPRRRRRPSCGTFSRRPASSNA